MWQLTRAAERPETDPLATFFAFSALFTSDMRARVYLLLFPGIKLTKSTCAVMTALRPLSAKIAALGCGLAVPMFLTTLSFILSTSGWEASLGGFPALSVLPGQFLLKDVILLGAALWLLGKTLQDIF
jgi:uncharacterized membrane protein YkgB